MPQEPVWGLKGTHIATLKKEPVPGTLTAILKGTPKGTYIVSLTGTRTIGALIIEWVLGPVYHKYIIRNPKQY